MKAIRKIGLLLVAVLFTTGCVLNSVGLYTADQYNTQATQVAQAQATIATDKTTIAAQEAKITGLLSDVTKLTADAQSLKSQVSTLMAARDKANNDLANYQALVCPDYTWKEMTNNVRVWFLSDLTKSAQLLKVEKDTQVSFLLTQWLPMSAPVDPNAPSWVLTVDAYNGMALDSAHGCVILDPAKWKIGK